MQEWLINPVVQGAVLPFLAGLLASVLLAPVRLGGLAACAGFATAVYLVVGFEFTPLTTVRKLFLCGFGGSVVGVFADLAFRPTRLTAPVLCLAGAASTAWIFLALLRQKDLAQALLYGAGTAAYVAWMIGATVTLREDAVRAGAASFALGLGTGGAAIFAASATLGLYAMSFGSAAGAFLLLQMATGKRGVAGISLTLTAGLLAGLLGAAALYLAQLPWYALAVMTFVPVAARTPVPSKWPIWGQSVALCMVSLAVAAVACWLVWESSRVQAG